MENNINIKKSFIMACCFTIISSIILIVPVNALSFYKRNGLTDNSAEILKETSKASLSETFGENYDEVLASNLSATYLADELNSALTDNDTEEYPEYFGGMYIADDFTTLTIQIVSDYVPTNESSYDYKIYSDILSTNENIKIQYVKNSYNDLNNLQDYISNFFSNGNSIYDNIVESYIDTINNELVVVLKNNSEEQQQIFKNLVIDSELIRFESGSSVDVYTTTLKPGKQISAYGGSC